MGAVWANLLPACWPYWRVWEGWGHWVTSFIWYESMLDGELRLAGYAPSAMGRQWNHLTNPTNYALDKYPTMHHFVTEMCTFLLQNGALWDMGLVYCGIVNLVYTIQGRGAQLSLCGVQLWYSTTDEENGCHLTDIFIKCVFLDRELSSLVMAWRWISKP